MTRTPEEVFAHCAKALGARDLDEIVADYAHDAVFITSSGVLRGKEGVRAGFTDSPVARPEFRLDVLVPAVGDPILGTPACAVPGCVHSSRYAALFRT
jgi:ketosteroid isomerase-like protein